MEEGLGVDAIIGMYGRSTSIQNYCDVNKNHKRLFLDLVG